MKTSVKIVTVASTMVLTGVGLASCAQNNQTNDNSASDKPSATQSADNTSESAAAGDDGEVGAVKANHRPEECGLQEQAGPEGQFGPFEGAIHYFQPGQMMNNPGNKTQMRAYADSQMHLELDFKANEYATNWGYSVDETPANLPIVYKLTDKNNQVISAGKFSEMNAIDGSHYGTNLPKDTIKAPGEYKMTITVYPPHDYDFHNDYITGVPAREVWKPLTVTMPWEITQKNLDTIKENTVSDPMAVPDKCKSYPVKMYKDDTAEKAMKDAESAEPLPLEAE